MDYTPPTPPEAGEEKKVWCKQWLGRYCWLNPNAVEAMGDTALMIGSLMEAIIGGAYEVKGTLKENRRVRVRLVSFGGRKWVLKRYQSTRRIMRLYHWLRVTPCWREWRGARKLWVSGARVCLPVALMHDGRHKVLSQGLVFPFVQGLTLDQIIQMAPAPEQWSAHYMARRKMIARAIGRQIGGMSAVGLVNRDYKPSNLIVDDSVIYDGSTPIMIDAAGIRKRRNDQQIFRMLAVLLRAGQRVGFVSQEESAACIAAMLQADPTIAQGQPKRIHYIAEQVIKINEARPLSPDAEPWEEAPQRAGSEFYEEY